MTEKLPPEQGQQEGNVGPRSHSLSATAGTNQVALSWTTHSTAFTVPRLTYRAGTSGSYASLSVSGFGYTHTGLIGGTTYYYRMWWETQDGTSGSANATASATPTASTTTTSAPGVPTSVSLATVGHDSVRLTWSSGSGDAATSYQVETRQGTSGGWTSRGTQTSPYTLNGLNADTLYQARVRATNSAGSSAYSSPDSATTDEETTTITPLGAPTNLTVTGNADSRSLSWSAPTENGGSAIIGYTIARQTPGQNSPTVYVSNTGSTATSYTDNETLTLTGTYFYWVAAITALVNDGPYSSSATLVITTVEEPTTAPGVPTSVSATSPSSTSIRLTWNAPTSGWNSGRVRSRVQT